MEGSTDDISSALESFREQWRAEVRAKQPGTSQSQSQGQGAAQAGGAGKPGAGAGPGQPESKEPAADSPQTALALYEEAVEMESRGKLGESLRLYRTAFRMDDNVDRMYKAKHFPHAPPPPAAKPVASSLSSSAVTSAPQPGGHQPRGPAAQATAVSAAAPAPATAAARAEEPAAPPPKPRVSLDDLVGGFAGLGIQPAPPQVEGMPPPPCPISTLPDEVLLHILLDVALDDVGDFVRLAQVCRHMAFLVATEERTWRRVCLGSEFGFGAMPRLWMTDLTWETPSGDGDGGGGAGGQGALALGDGDDDEGDAESQAESPSATAWSLLKSTYNGSWQTMFRLRPRIRFNGCYISTVNYIREGQASANIVTWNSPVHVVTYFRYLRFFRDGTCISLLTTTEPADVIPHLSKENLELHRGAPVLSLPSSVMQYAHKGRWRLGSAGPAAGAGVQAQEAAAASTAAAALGGPPDDQSAPSEGDLFIETEGVGKYMYRLDLALKTAGKGAKNNKLVWRGFWSYNRLTDDWAEFGLKNDKAFIFSRVKRFAS